MHDLLPGEIVRLQVKLSSTNAWRGGIRVASVTSSANKNTGITPIITINIRMIMLSKPTILTKAGLRRVTRQVSLFLAGVS